MGDRFEFATPVGTVHAAFTDRSDGDLGRGVGTPELASRRRSVVAHPWTSLDQVHGSSVVVVDRPGGGCGTSADAAVTTLSAAVLSVQVADCAPVLMFSPTGTSVVIAAAHAGWRGLLDGVLASTVAAMRDLGASRIDWLVGPCISAADYEFSETDLEPLVAAFGPSVRGTADSGAPAFDVRAAVTRAMSMQGCPRPLHVSAVCTASSDSHWSHRRSGDTARQVGAIWWERA